MHAHVKERKITGTGGKDKTIIAGLLERSEDGVSRVDVRVVPNRKAKTQQPRIRDNVDSGSRICSDTYVGYDGLDDGYVHRMVDHFAKQYVVDGDVHVNSMENFWTLLKRSLKGTYVRATPKHLEAYADEQAMRFNERYHTDAFRFHVVMSRVVGRRLTWKELVNKEGKK